MICPLPTHALAARIWFSEKSLAGFMKCNNNVRAVTFTLKLNNYTLILCLHPVACVRSWFSRLCNVTIVRFYYLLVFLLNCYMFRSYDHPQAEIYLLEYYTTDNGSVVFRTLGNIMDNYSDRFDWYLVT
jgi:hypothetical protein